MSHADPDAVGQLARDLFATVRQLQTFMSALAANDSLVRQFNTNFAATLDHAGR